MMTVQVQCGCGCRSTFNMRRECYTGKVEIGGVWSDTTPFKKEDKREIHQYLKDWKNRGGKIDRIIVKFV
jgi:hypothetical protein